MQRTLLRSLYKETDKYADKEVYVCGWIRNLRDSKTFGFMISMRQWFNMQSIMVS